MQNLTSKKWLFITGGCVLLIIILALLTARFAPRGRPVPQGTGKPFYTPTPEPAKNLQVGRSSLPRPTQSMQELRAIAEQKNADAGFAKWEQENKAAYPWIQKIPIRTDKYFVYFDLNKKEFVGSVYPAKGEDPEPIKTEAIKVLKEVKGIPVEQYKFAWTVFPK